MKTYFKLRERLLKEAKDIISKLKSRKITKGKIFIDIYIYLAEYNIFGIERARTGRGKGNVCKTIQEGNKSLKLLD